MKSQTDPDPDGDSLPGKALRTEFTNNDDGSLASQSDFSGSDTLPYRTTSYLYDHAGQLISETGPLNRTTQYQYDVLGRTIVVTDPLQHTTTANYDAVDQLVSTTDATGYTVTFTYDGVGQQTSAYRPGLGTQRQAFDANGNITSQTDEEQYATSYRYDNLGRLLSTTDPNGSTTSHVYNILGQLVSTTDPNGNTIYQEYDSLGRLSKDGKDLVHNVEVETFTYSTSGLLTTQTDTLGLTTIYNYDHGRLESVTDPIEGLSEYDYDNLGNVVAVKERAYQSGGNTVFGRLSTFTYDFLGRLITSVVPGKGTTTNTYDLADRLTSSDVGGKTTGYSYDAADRLLSITDPMDRTTTYTYDADGRQLTITDPLSHTQSTVYTPAGQVAEAHDANGGVTYYTYTPSGNLATIKDPRNNVTTYTYDGAHQLTTESTTDGTRTYQYDAAGNLISAKDRLNRIRTFDYQFDFDGEGFYQQTHEIWWSGSTAVNDLETIYDSRGRVITADDRDSRYVYEYSSLSQVAYVRNELTKKLPLATAVAFNYEYDAYGRNNYTAAYQQGVNPIGYGGTDFEYVLNTAYNYDDSVKSILQFAFNPPNNHVTDKLITFSYDSTGRLTQIDRKYNEYQAFGPYLRTNYTYNDDDEIVGIVHNDINLSPTPPFPETATPVASYSWTYDSAGRVISATSSDGTATYTYDNTDQLTGVNNSSLPDETYAYDSNGNRTGGGYTTGAFNRITSDGTYNYTYDAEGHRISQTTIATGAYVSYAWDYRQRLTDVTFKTSVSGTVTKHIAYTYDVYDRLLVKQLDSDGNGAFNSTERYVYDGDNVVMTMDGTDQVSHFYLYGPGTDQLFADETSLGNILWSLADNLGTIRDWVDFHPGSTVATNVDHVKYDAYGNITSQSNPGHDINYAFTGRVWDADASLYYYRARWYDPHTGGFISEDPSGFLAGDDNLLRYASNSVTNLTDPSGLDSKYQQHWHHLFPQKVFTADFLKKYNLSQLIDINAIQNGFILFQKDHIGENGLHPAGWNKDWKNWIKSQIDKNIALTQQSIEKQLEKMKKSKKYKDILANGKPAEMDYATWQDKSARDKFFEEKAKAKAKADAEAAAKKPKTPKKKGPTAAALATGKMPVQPSVKPKIPQAIDCPKPAKPPKPGGVRARGMLIVSFVTGAIVFSHNRETYGFSGAVGRATPGLSDYLSVQDDVRDQNAEYEAMSTAVTNHSREVSHYRAKLLVEQVYERIKDRSIATDDPDLDAMQKVVQVFYDHVQSRKYLQLEGFGDGNISYGVIQAFEKDLIEAAGKPK